VREGLRLFPPVVMAPFWKAVPAAAAAAGGEGDTLCGVRLPPGTLVSSAHGVWVGNREEGFWGGDGGLFRPERWYVALSPFLLSLKVFAPLFVGGCGVLSFCVRVGCWGREVLDERGIYPSLLPALLETTLRRGGTD
jgi:hypothetical protein